MMEQATIPYAFVVDDDAFILMDACDILKRAGFRFYEASNCDEPSCCWPSMPTM
jgi:hypothetical protein